MGQSIFTCWFLFMEKEFRSAVWLRQDLKHFKFKKRARKLLRRNGKILEVKIGRAVIDRHKERLYHLHKTRFKKSNHDTLRRSMLGESHYSIYRTMQIELFLNGELIAASFFDVGQNSMASIAGLFNPLYDRYSLGFYTMLLEMQFAMEQGFRYYYPGYYVPGHQKFDYKIRIGNVDYFDYYQQQWLPLNQLNLKYLPSRLLKRRMETVQYYLDRAGIQSEIYFFPPYESSGVDPFLKDMLKHPIFLRCISPKFKQYEVFATYNLKREVYELAIYYNMDNFSDWIIGHNRPAENGKFSYNAYMYGEHLKSSPSPKIIVQALLEFLHGSSVRFRRRP